MFFSLCILTGLQVCISIHNRIIPLLIWRLNDDCIQVSVLQGFYLKAVGINADTNYLIAHSCAAQSQCNAVAGYIIAAVRPSAHLRMLKSVSPHWTERYSHHFHYLERVQAFQIRSVLCAI